MKDRFFLLLSVCYVMSTAWLISACSSDQTPDRIETERTQHERRVIEVFRSASTSVVHITAKSLVRDRFSLSIYERNEGTGTGFLWDNDGHIVTNYHVIREGNRAQVTFASPLERETNLVSELSYDAKVVGISPDRDLAVLKIDTGELNLKPLPLGDSKSLAVGQSALAIGNPFGFDQTLTTGVVSGLGREIKSVTQRVIKGVIQTDAAINPGNSGGPLLNSQGQVIGVNTAIYSPSGAYAGIGFAVPIDTVKRVIPQLITYGAEVRPSLGIELDEGRLSQRYELPGALILSVEPGSSAMRAKLRGLRWNRRRLIWGDVILSIDGERTEDAEDVYAILDTKKLGQEVTLEVQRGFGSKAKKRRVRLILKGRVEGH